MANRHPSGEEFASKTYDFIIIGGGTAGLVLAARLTENPSVTVGVIEAGENRMDDPMVQIPGLHSQMYEKSDYDWMFKTVPQVSVAPLLVYKRATLISRFYRNMSRMTFMGGRGDVFWEAQAQSTMQCWRKRRSRTSTTGLPWETPDGLGMISYRTTRSSKPTPRRRKPLRRL